MADEANASQFDPFAGPVILATAPSTAPQREIWTACALGDDASLAFNESITVRLVGRLDLAAFRGALGDLVERHEALRTTLSGDGLTLCLNAPGAPELTEHDLRELSAVDADARLKALAEQEVNLPFDLTKGPLFRAHIALLPAGQHALVFTAHHVICDGWSTAVLMRDWAALYNARAKGQSANLDPADPLFAYARARAEGPAPQQQANEEYWLKQFAGELPVLDLPSDRPRPARKTYRAGREDALLDAELVTAVRKAGAKARSSLFATLLAAFNALVFRLSAQADLVVGIPAAGQAAEEHPGLVGHCVNMLPLRSALRADEPFSALLGRVRKTLLDAQEHQDFTFGTLLTKLPLGRDPSRLPLVSVIFNVDRGMTSDAIGFDGIVAELKANARSHENFELFLNAVEIDGKIELECQYNADLFDRQSVRRWLDSYRLLLLDIAAAPDTALGALAMMTDAERLQIAAWNATDASFARESCVYELVEQQAKRAPERVACVFGDQSISYGELDARSNRLAQKLRGLGVKRGGLVGLCLERGIELLVGLLGIQKAGAAYVPLDPGYPRDRLAFMVEDSGMQALVTDSALRSELGLQVSQTFCVDLEREALGSGSAERLPNDADSATPESVAYVIYTSGSTGKPKGVLVPHRAVVNLLNSTAKRPGLTESDVVLAITTLSFDIAVSEIWLPLVVGAKIVMVSRDTAADGAQLRDVCEQRGVTFIDATPASYRLLLGAGWRGNSSLKLICTGEAMPKDLALELPRCAGSVWNGYGPTETTVWSTFWQVPENAAKVLIGQPVDNTRIHILDAQRRHTPIGVSGEIYIAGEGVTLGYLNRPELTQDRFIADPFDPSGARMYRTGDLGRYLGNGDIECLGRNDNQVKLRGFRIELGEIEDALARHEGIAEAAVILREDRPGDARLVGYVVLRGAAALVVAQLRTHLQRTLPDYMIPASYVTLPRMPLTPSGKIDRRALPAPEASGPTADADFVPPRTETERLLADLWASALNVARVSVDDDFFALGGHSLLASQILARLRRDHGIELSFRRFFEAPSVARLAELIDGAPAVAPLPSVAIQRHAPGTVLPLSLGQERLWLLEEMHPAQRIVHNLPAAWRLTGVVDAELLQQSLDRIAQRHAVLRTSLSLEGNRATQRVSEHVALTIAQADLRELPAERREVVMFEQIRELTAIPFDLASGPLFRSTLFRLGDAEYVYFTVRHNIIWDGWSFDLFLQELCTIYGALQHGKEPSLPALPISYGDYAIWQREWVKGPQLAQQIAFWQSRLAGDVPDLGLPLDRPRPSQTQHAGANTALPISRADAEALTAVARRAGTTLFNLLFAAYAIVLHRFSDQAELVVGTPVRARNLPEVEGLIGPFINAVVLRTVVDPNQPFLEYLTKVRELTLDAFSNQDMPLELLGTRPPIVRAFFSFQDAKLRPVALGDASVAQIDVEPPAAANDLMLWLMDRPHELLAVANFSTEVFDTETIRRLLRSFVALLRDVSVDPTRRIGELSLLAGEDRDALDSLSPPPPSTSGSPLAYARSIERLAAAPEALAFAGQDGKLSNAELGRKARSIAHAIASRVEPGEVVALMLPSSVQLAAATLAVLLAGCVVLPVDANAPESYRAALLKAGKPQLVVCLEPQRDAVAGLDVALVSVAELSAGLTETPFRGASADAAAWLELALRTDGEAVTSRISHATLAARVGALALSLQGSVSSFVAWADPLCDSLPLSLLLGAALGVPTELVASEGALETALAAASQDGASACVLLPPAACNALLSSGVAGAERLHVLLDGPASSPLLSRLQGGVRKLSVLFSSPAPASLLFCSQVTGPGEGLVVGRSLGRETVSVLDDCGSPVPIGAVGELYIEGDEPRSTGLRGRLRRDGRFELTAAPRNRMVWGQRFSPTTVARALELHPAIARAAAVLADDQGTERVVAYFVPHSSSDYTDTELRRHLRGSLPGPLVPQRFIEVPALPLAADGSVDQGKLPAPFDSGRQGEFVAPRNDSERLVAELYAEALNLARISVYDNFFDLGGHSLLCFRVIERIERRVGKRLSPRTLLLSSVEQVASELGLGSGATPAVSEPAGIAAAQGASLKDRMFKKLTGLLGR